MAGLWEPRSVPNGWSVSGMPADMRVPMSMGEGIRPRDRPSESDSGEYLELYSSMNLRNSGFMGEIRYCSIDLNIV
ncbi:MAG: hypothetical protein A4E39_00008 [Methanoregulaceae archaeon PtaB.Bin152]|nr:MAG: hypothetical protein A4E39_00008 [Methanoregulaceae archaeon PtaB.Bin152]